MNVSVLILTLNEELNITRCLQSVDWCDDVVVLDSFSTDRTVEIARSLGARVVQRQFDNYAAQRNHGLRDIEYSNEWILMLDADECVTRELRDEIAATLVGVDKDTTLFQLRRKDYLLGRWIKRSSGYPTWFGRLARAGHVWVERPINEQYCTSGRTAQLRSHIDHFPFNKGFSAWLSKHDRYSTMEADLFAHKERTPELASVTSADPVARRRALKRVLYSLPARPLVVFVGLYFLRGGILEGRAGLTFSLLRTWYEFMIDCKRHEATRRAAGLPL